MWESFGVVLSIPDTFLKLPDWRPRSDENCVDCYSVQFLKSWQFDRYARLESSTPCLGSPDPKATRCRSLESLCHGVQVV